MTEICKDCMKGHHELSCPTCECSCHNNPICLYCGKLLEDRKAMMHDKCYESYEIGLDSEEDYKRSELERIYDPIS